MSAYFDFYKHSDDLKFEKAKEITLKYEKCQN